MTSGKIAPTLTVFSRDTGRDLHEVALAIFHLTLGVTMWIFIVIRLVLEVVFDVVGHLVFELFGNLLSYQDRPFEKDSSASTDEAIKRLTQHLDTPASAREIEVVDASVESIKIRSSPFFGPVFRGQLERRDQGCTLRGRMGLSTGARTAYALAGLSGLSGAALGLTTPSPCATICAALTLTSIFLIVAGLRISAHKRQLLAGFERQIAGMLESHPTP